MKNEFDVVNEGFPGRSLPKNETDKTRRRASRRLRQCAMEFLEPRWVLANDLAFSAEEWPTGLNLSLELNDTSDEPWLAIRNLSNGEIVASERLADITESVGILGSPYDDTLSINFDVVSRLPDVPIFFEGGAGNDRLVGHESMNTWNILDSNSGTAGPGDVQFESVEALEGAANNEDTFIVHTGGQLSDGVYGGDAGFDSLEFRAEYSSLIYFATGPHSGSVVYDDVTLEYDGLEPIVGGDAANVTITGTPGDDIVTLGPDPGDPTQLLVASTNGTMESVSFGVPTGSLVVDLLGGNDSISIGDLNIPGVDLTVNSESITVNPGATIDTFDGGVDYGDISFLAVDSQDDTLSTGFADIDAATSINLTDATIVGGDITLSASSSGTADNFLDIELLIAEGDAAIALVDSDATVTVGGSSSISSNSDGDSTGDTVITATSVATTAAAVQSQSTGGTGFDISAAASSINSDAVAELTDTASIAADGAVRIEANNTINGTTTANGTAGGPTVIGTGLAFAFVNETTRASIEDSAGISSASSVDVHTTTDNVVNTTADATPNGANPSAADANAALASLIGIINTATGLGIPVITIPTLPTGGFGVAAALSVTSLDSNSAAFIDSSGSITTAGNLNVLSENDSDVQTIADGSITDPANALTRVGAALALNVIDIGNDAYLASTPSIVAADVIVEASMNNSGPDGTHTLDATATSGAAGTDVGVAGAAALNIVTENRNEASVRSGANVDLNGGDLSLLSEGVSLATANANPANAGGLGPIGVGGSVAVNIAGATTRSAIDDGGQIVNARDLDLIANGDNSMTTVTESGAAGGTAVGAGLAFTLGNNDTIAELGSGSDLSLSGTLNSNATQLGTTASTADSAAAATNVAIGAAFGLNLAFTDATSTSRRNVNAAGDVAFDAVSDVVSQSDGVAGARGVDAASTDVNTLISDAVSYLDAQGTDAFGAPTVPVGTIPSAETPDGPVSVAAALGVNAGISNATATIPSGVAVTAGNTLTVRAGGDHDSGANADGVAVDDSVAGFGVGAAVSVNVGIPNTTAENAGTLNAPTVTIETVMAGDGTSATESTTTSGAGAANVGVAGSLALNVATNSSTATVRPTGVVNAGATSTVSSTNVTSSHAAATPAGVGVMADLGIGASLAVNVDVVSTTAELEDGSAIIGGSELNVVANSNKLADTTAQAGAQSAGGGLATPALGVNLAFTDTTARVGTSATPINVSGNVEVRAEHLGVTTTTSDANVEGNVALGAAFGVTVADDDVTATTGRVVNAGGNVSIESETTASSVTNVDASATGAAAAGDDPGVTINDILTFFGSNATVPESIPIVDFEASLSEGKVSTDGGLEDPLIDIEYGIDLQTIGAAAAIGVHVPLPTAIAAVEDDGLTANPDITAGGLLTIESTMNADGVVLVEADAVSEGSGASAALAINYADVDNRASVDAGADVVANDIDIVAQVASGDVNSFVSTAIGGGDSSSASVDGSIALNLVVGSSQAFLGNGASLQSATNTDIVSESSVMATSAAGADSMGRDAAGGVAIVLNALHTASQAYLDNNATANVAGTLTIRAEGEEEVFTLSQGAADAELGAVAGSVSLNTVIPVTRAYIAPGSNVNQTIAPGSQNVIVTATGDTNVTSGSGTTATADIAGVGAAFDAGTIVKETQAFVSGTVDSDNDVQITAQSFEDVSSASASSEGAWLATVAGAGSAYYLIITTQSFVDSAADILAQGNVVVTADDETETDQLAGNTSTALGAGVGAGAAVVVVDKTTEAFLATGANVDALATKSGVDALTGTFGVQFVDDVNDPLEVDALGVDVIAPLNLVFDTEYDIDLGIFEFTTPDITDVDAIADEDSLTQQRVATAQSRSDLGLPTVRGLIVQSTSQDDIETLSLGFAASLTASPEMSAGAKVIQSKTYAYIDDNAMVNKDDAGASADQAVYVTAGSDTHDMGIAGALSVGGILAAGAAIDMALVNNQTKSFIDTGADVEARREAHVVARAQEDVLAIAAGLSGSLAIGVAPSSPVVSIESLTQAYINGTVTSDGSILVLATDDTDADAVAGSFAVGLGVSLGASVGIVNITKDTQAFIGNGANVNALANSGSTVAAFDGGSDANGYTTELIEGLAVQAVATEQLLNLAGAGSGGFGLGIAGSATVSIIDSDTAAFIDTANVNTMPGASADQTVNVSSTNDVWVSGVPINLQASDTSLAGGLDFGFLLNGTTASIRGAADVRARRDIDVNALSTTEIDSFVGGVGVSFGGLSLEGSLSLYSIGTAPAMSNDGFVDSTVQTIVDGIAGLVGGATTDLRNFVDGNVATASMQITNAFNQLSMAVNPDASTTLTAAALTSPFNNAVMTAEVDGTLAYIDGATNIEAGRDLNLKSEETIDHVADTSLTIGVDIDGASLALDASIIRAHHNSQAYIHNATDVSAIRDINLSADSITTQKLASLVAIADVDGTTSANVANSTISSADNVNLDATSNATQTPVSRSFLGSGFELPRIALAESEVVVDSHVSGSSDITASQNISIHAQDNNVSDVQAFVLSNSINGDLNVAASVAVSDISDLTTAYIDSATVNSTGGDVLVTALAEPQVSTLAFAEAGNFGSTAIAPSFSYNEISSTMDTHISGGADVDALGEIDVRATDRSDLGAFTGGVALAPDAGIGAAVSINDMTNVIDSYIDGSDVRSSSDVVNVVADSQPKLQSITAGLAGAGDFALGGSVSIAFVDNKVDAHIANVTAPKQVSGNDGVTVSAIGRDDIKLIAGAVGASGSAAIGASNTTLLHDKSVSAYIGSGSQVNADGGTGVVVSADAGADIISVAAAGSAAGTAAISGSAVVNELNGTTTAYIGTNANVTSANGFAPGAPGVFVTALDETKIVPVAGSLAAAGTAAVGVGADVGLINKNTSAYIDSGATVTAEGDIFVTANSMEDVTSVAAGLSASGSVAITMDASVHIFDIKTRAFIGDDPDEETASVGAANVHAGGNVSVAADDVTELDKIVGVLAVATYVGIGAGGGVTTIDKNTEAFIGEDARVTGDGNTGGISVATGGFDVGSVAASDFDPNDPSGEGIETSDPSTLTGDADALGAEGEVNVPALDALDADQSGGDELNDSSLNGQRTSALATTGNFRGVSVTATNRDDIEVFTISLAGGVVGVAISAAVNIVDTNTVAYVGDGAEINPHSTNPHADQSVNIASGSDFYHLAIAGSLSGGIVGASPATAITILSSNVDASVRANATVEAEGDIVVEATNNEDVMLIGIGVSGGIVAIGGAVITLTIDNVTDATIDVGAEVEAGGNVLVLAADDTEVDTVAGAAA